MSNKEDLKPCPFCDGEACTLIDETGYTPLYSVQCCNCKFETPAFDERAKAIDTWNGYNYTEKQLANARSVYRENLLSELTKLSYADIKKMVKLKWDGDTATFRLNDYGEVIFKIQRNGQNDIFTVQIETNSDISNIKCGLAEEDVKPVLQDFLVELIAIALGVEKNK